MKKALISVIVAGIVIILAVWLIVAGCSKDKNEEPKQPGYIPPDLTYETDEKLPGGETTAPETDVPEGSGETQPQWGDNDTRNPETEDAETDAPETDAPATAAPETDAPEITVPDTTPPETTAPETKVPETDEDWFESMWGTEEPVPETDPPETDPPYYPDNAPTPDKVNYMLMSVESYREFIFRPTADVMDNGYNYYTCDEGGTVNMHQVTNRGFERYVGEYKGGEMDLSLDVIDFVLSGDMQEMLIENEVNNTVLELCAISIADSYSRETVIWVETKDGDYIFRYDSDSDEGESQFKLYSYKEYLGIDD